MLGVFLKLGLVFVGNFITQRFTCRVTDWLLLNMRKDWTTLTNGTPFDLSIARVDLSFSFWDWCSNEVGVDLLVHKGSCVVHALSSFGTCLGRTTVRAYWHWHAKGRLVPERMMREDPDGVTHCSSVGSGWVARSGLGCGLQPATLWRYLFLAEIFLGVSAYPFWWWCCHLGFSRVEACSYESILIIGVGPRGS